jgi:hypothetical protein
MKLIIDIPEDVYRRLKAGDTNAGNTFHNTALETIGNGIPYEERPQGEWEYTQYDGNPNIGNWHCSECRHIVPGMYISKPEDNFCSFCGADMRGGEK